MSAITIDDELVHYEVLGRGKPIILVHGWLGSWRYWVPTMQQLSMKYRCYALDLWGFGDSGKDPSRYALEKQTELLGKFIQHMGIPRVVLVGHGLGAAISAQYATHPNTAEKVHRLLLVCPPLLDAAPNPTAQALTDNRARLTSGSAQLPDPLTDSQTRMPTAAEARAKQAAEKNGVILAANMLKTLFTGHTLDDLLSRATDNTASDYEKLKAEVVKTDTNAVHQSTEAFNRINTFRDLMTVAAPVCTLLGENDNLLPKPDEALLHRLDELQHMKILVMGNTQHFPMLEDKAQFVRVLKDFLEAPDVTSLEMKEEWRRRKR